MVVNLWRGFLSRCRRWRLRQRGMYIPGAAWLRAIEVPRQARRIALEDGVALDRGVTLLVSGSEATSPAIHIGRRVYVNRYTIIDASASVQIGDDCMIGPFCYITDHDHSSGTDGRPGSGELVSRPVKIGARAWLGAHVTVLKGVAIGEGAIIGAGSVVTRDVPAHVTVVGNPARPLR